MEYRHYSKQLLSVVIFLPFLILCNCAIFDSEDPKVEITSHADGDVVASPFLLSGTASDNDAVRIVEYRIDSGEYAPVEGTGHWNILISANAGSHYITVKAADYNGNTGYAYINIIIE